MLDRDIPSYKQTFKNYHHRGDESRDFFHPRIRIFVIISLIVNEFSYGKAKIHHPSCCKPLYKRHFHFYCIFSHNLEQRQKVFARGCVENSLRIKEVINNFRIRSVRI